MIWVVMPEAETDERNLYNVRPASTLPAPPIICSGSIVYWGRLYTCGQNRSGRLFPSCLVRVGNHIRMLGNAVMDRHLTAAALIYIC
jgi:hypothetical protein